MKTGRDREKAVMNACWAEVKEKQMSTEQKLQQEIVALDREAREAMDRLADKREELEKQHRATSLAAERQREREEERRRQEQEEAERKAAEEAKARREKIAEKRRELEAERERLANRIIEILSRLEELDGELVEEANLYDTERANAMMRSFAGRHRRWLKEKFGV